MGLGFGRLGRSALFLVLPLCIAASPAVASDAGDRSGDDAARARSLWKEGAELHVEGDYGTAIERYTEALRLHPTARLHTYLARSLARLGRYAQAADQCRKAIAVDAAYGNAYNDLGAYLIALGRPREAIHWLRRALDLGGFCCRHVSYYQLGRALLMQARVEEAAKAFEAALAVQPRYQPARRLLDGVQSSGIRGL